MTSDAAASPPPTLLESYSPSRPLLMLTDYAPDFGGGGAVILRSLLSPRDYPRLVWATLAPANTEVRADGLRVTALARRSRPWKPAARSAVLDSTVRASTLADEVLSLAREHNAAALWSVLHNAVVPVTAALLKRDGLPVHCTVHDDPAFATALRSRRSLLLTPWIEHALREALTRCRSVDVIGEGMAARYRERFGVSSVVVHRGLDGPIERSQAYDREAHGLRVAVLGNTYGHQQLDVLSRAMAEASRMARVKATLTIIGGGSVRVAQHDDVQVERLGHLDEASAVDVLRSCYLQYLNYPFGLRDRVLRQTSFPTKLTTYVQSARPILLHAPPDSSTSSLRAFGSYVVDWDSMDVSHGSRLLQNAWRTESLAASVEDCAERVRKTFYDLASHRRTLSSVLNALQGA